MAEERRIPVGAAEERRFTRSAIAAPTLQPRAEGGGLPTIVGYAAVFHDPTDPGTEYELWDDMVERMMPGCFDRALREDDIRGLFNHDSNMVLGRNRSGTMKLTVDAKGLRYEITPPDTSVARDVVELLRRGDVSGSSFMFVPDSTTYRKEGKRYVVERNAVRLFDCGPVAFPAYKSATSGVRSAAADPETTRREVEAWAAAEAARSGVGFAAQARVRARLVQTLLAG